jgi:hypothetical protein
MRVTDLEFQTRSMRGGLWKTYKSGSIRPAPTPNEDMPGIDPSIIVHQLNVDEKAKPIKQKRRRSFAAKRNQAAANEIEKLPQANFI